MYRAPLQPTSGNGRTLPRPAPSLEGGNGGDRFDENESPHDLTDLSDDDVST
jgi:hypothetical protein